MIAQGRGKIINIASLFAFLGGKSSPAYAATKAGIVGFTKAYCDELAGARHLRQRDRPRLLRRPRSPRRRGPTRSPTQRIVEHIPAETLGRPDRPDGRAGVPGLPRLRLRQRPRAGRRRRLPRSLNPHPRPPPDHHARTDTPIMTASRSPSRPRPQIVDALTDLLSATPSRPTRPSCEPPASTASRSITAVHDIYDGPIPAAIVYPASTAEVAAVLEFADANLINRRAAHRSDSHRGRPGDGHREHGRGRTAPGWTRSSGSTRST